MPESLPLSTLYTYCKSSTPPSYRGDWEELTSTTFLNLVESPPQLKNSTSLGGYCRAAVRYTARTEWATRARHARMIALRAPNITPPKEDVVKKLIQKESVALCLDTLPPLHREILERFYLCGETQEEVMASLGLTANQFRLGKSRALAAARRKMKES